jgi:uncharacterized protein (TIGR00288 family)
MEKDKNLAVLIDGDNIPSKYIKEMMLEIAKYGNPTVKRIYGDWTKPHLNKWKTVLLEHAINPMQQYSYTSGKNATDSAMIIDAMDILYSGKVDGFCIASSDSDFTRLATRIRETGLTVIGIGEKKTPDPFIVACDRFIYLEILHDDEDDSLGRAATKQKQAKSTVESINPKLIKLIKQSVTDLADDEGWAFLGEVGALIQKKRPSFDARNYGFSKLTPLIQATGKFEIDQRDGGGRYKLIYIKCKD